jgi:hypothetical protein
MQLSTPERLSKILVSMAQQIKAFLLAVAVLLLSIERRLQEILTDNDKSH